MKSIIVALLLSTTFAAHADDVGFRPWGDPVAESGGHNPTVSAGRSGHVIGFQPFLATQQSIVDKVQPNGVPLADEGHHIGFQPWVL